MVRVNTECGNVDNVVDKNEETLKVLYVKINICSVDAVERTVNKF